MTQHQADNWSLTRALAFLAACFAIVFGSLLPFGAYAASPGQPIIICSAEGPQVIHAGSPDDPASADTGARCAACVMPLLADLPAPPAPQPLGTARLIPDQAFAALDVAAAPPARAPPRPPSTAPPLS